MKPDHLRVVKLKYGGFVSALRSGETALPFHLGVWALPKS
jgi:hypothetical protein